MQFVRYTKLLPLLPERMKSRLEAVDLHSGAQSAEYNTQERWVGGTVMPVDTAWSWHAGYP